MFDNFKLLKSTDVSYYLSLAVLAVLVISGYFAAHYMDVNGHWVTGMNNQVVWGLPHVFAILLILAASGALNVASISSVFGKADYKPWTRLSGLVAICMLVGGLLVLVLDLGRPERLIVAMTHYNFKSIFAWNIFLYTGFAAVVVLYLWTMFEPAQNRHTGRAGLLAFCWRFVLTAGTGSIFGFIVAREMFDTAMMVPVFIVLSLVLGTAFFMLVVRALSCWSGESDQPGQSWFGLGRLLGIFLALELFLVAAMHFTGLYAAEHQGVENFLLFSVGSITWIFWLGQVILGSIVPIYLLLSNAGQSVPRVTAAVLLAIFGGVCQLYVVIIGGQSYPQVLFPGKTVSSSFFDGEIARYVPSLPEWSLGIGGLALALFLVVMVTRILPFYPRATD